MIEVAAQAADLDADDRVVLRVEALVAAEHRHREVGRLEPVGAPGQPLLDDVGQQLAPARAGGARGRAQQLREMLQNGLGGRRQIVPRLWSRRHRSPAVARCRCLGSSESYADYHGQSGDVLPESPAHFCGNILRGQSIER